MTFTKKWGWILLAVFLILYGLTAFLPVIPGIVTAIVAIVAGILILIDR